MDPDSPIYTTPPTNPDDPPWSTLHVTCHVTRTTKYPTRTTAQDCDVDVTLTYAACQRLIDASISPSGSNSQKWQPACAFGGFTSGLR